jgi:hypothetical protein
MRVDISGEDRGPAQSTDNQDARGPAQRASALSSPNG